MRKILLIAFLLIISLNFVLAGNISLDYPQEVEIEEEFTITLTLTDFPEGSYDVKFDTSSSMGANLFRIYDGTTWKSSNYYVNNVISNNGEEAFLVKVPEYEGDIDFKIKIRKTGTSAALAEFDGYTITSVRGANGTGNNNNNNGNTNSTNNNNNSGNGNEEEEDEDEEDADEDSQNEISDSDEDSDKEETREADLTPIQLTTLALSPKDIKTSDSNKNLESVGYSKYLIVIFCVILLFLYLIKPKTKKNEFKT